MKIVLIGASGTVGKHVKKALEGHEIISVGRKSGDIQVNIADPVSVAAGYRQIGNFDAVVNASGDVAFQILSDLRPEHWRSSFASKLSGQINLVSEALPYINEGGSFTLISGILGEEFIRAGVVASTVNSALEGFVKAASLELPKKLRINVVSPSVLKDSMHIYGDFFPGFAPVDGERVGQAFKKSVMGIQSGTVFRVF